MKSNGFILIDSLFSFSLVLLLVFSLTPILSIIQKERHNLSEKMKVASLLHDELQDFILQENPELPKSYTVFLKEKEIHIHLQNYKSPFIKGCASWLNLAKREDEICFYASI